MRLPHHLNLHPKITLKALSAASLLASAAVKDNLLFEFNLRRYPTGRDVRKIVELEKDPKDNF